jgi:hypothetical protein
VRRDLPERVLGALRALAVDRQHDVAGLQAGRRGRAVDVEVGDDDAAVREPELLRLRVGDVLGHDADPAADHAPVVEDLLHHAAREIDRDRKADALDTGRAGVFRQHRGVDADQFAGRVHQRAAGVALVDGRVGLDEVLEGRDAELAAAGGADDAVRHGLRQAQRAADRQHFVADLQPVGASQRHHRQFPELDPQHGEVGVRIAPDDRRLGHAAVSELDHDRVGIGDHVVVGGDVTLVVEDHAGAERALYALAVARPGVAEQLLNG